jgi:hypothetical protein
VELRLTHVLGGLVAEALHLRRCLALSLGFLEVITSLWLLTCVYCYSHHWPMYSILRYLIEFLIFSSFIYDSY